jgi:hypothetical protein
MKTFLISIAGMFVGGILLLVVLLLAIKFAIRWFLKKIVKAITDAAGQGVPPFRITLEKDDELNWQKPEAMNGAAAALEGIGYMRVGDFRSEEMPTVQLRVLANSTASTYAVLMQMALQERINMDIVCDFTDGTHVTVTTSPESGLDRPDWSNMIRRDIDLVAEPAAAVQLHERILEEQQGRPLVSTRPEKFVDSFCRAYAREMDWRVAHGMTADEVRRSCAATGTDPPTDEQVGIIVGVWRRAISEFVNEQLREKFLRHVTKMSAGEWEDVRNRLYIVHEHSDRDAVIEALAFRLEEADGAAAKNGDGGDSDDDDDDDSDEKSEALRARLRPLFAEASVRAAFSNAQELLPASQRYRRVAGIKTPYGADVYVEPAENGKAKADDVDAEIEEEQKFLTS